MGARQCRIAVEAINCLELRGDSVGVDKDGSPQTCQTCLHAKVFTLVAVLRWLPFQAGCLNPDWLDELHPCQFLRARCCLLPGVLDEYLHLAAKLVVLHNFTYFSLLSKHLVCLAVPLVHQSAPAAVTFVQNCGQFTLVAPEAS